MNTQAFQLAKTIGDNLGQGFQKFEAQQEEKRDLSSMGEILRNAQASDDPKALDNAMNQILSRIKDPKKREQGLGVLQKKVAGIQKAAEANKERDALIKEGYPSHYADLPDDVRKEKIKSDSLNQFFNRGNNQPIQQPIQDQQPIQGQQQNIDQQPTQQPIQPIQDQQQQQLSDDNMWEQMTPNEKAVFANNYPQAARAFQEDVKAKQTHFETESDKLEAKRVSERATEIENDYQVYLVEDQRLGRQEALADKGNLSTPAMVKTLDAMGIPLSVIGNPDNEEYSKVQAEYVRDVSKVFTGQIRVAEIEAYMKTVPTLMNSPEGMRAIIKNRRIQNEARKVRYDAYKEVIKENKGRKPNNMGILIEEKAGARLAELANQYKQGTHEAMDKFQPSLRMIDPDGNPIDVPTYKIESAQKAGARFQ
jgi:hypothetical protein